MSKSHIALGAVAVLALGSSLLATQPAAAAGGCGPGAWRGPWGHCRDTPYYGRLPDGEWKFRQADNGCPPGYWHGPWGHCRNTPAAQRWLEISGFAGARRTGRPIQRDLRGGNQLIRF